MNYSSLLSSAIFVVLFSVTSLSSAVGYNCEHATRVGMNQGCGIDRNANDAVIIDKNIEPMYNDVCEKNRKIGMDQGCSTSGGTGTSITYTPEDGSLGTCRQSYRSGNPAMTGCSDQTPISDMVIPK